MDHGKTRYPIRRAKLTSGDHGKVYDPNKPVDALMKSLGIRRIVAKPPTYRCSKCLTEWAIERSVSNHPDGWWICPQGCNIDGKADAEKKNRKAKAGRSKGVGITKPRGSGVSKKRRKKQKKITESEALRALYVDFEGRTDEAPVLMGVLFDDDPDGDGSWVVIQAVFDTACSRVDGEIATRCESVPAEATLAWLLAFSDDEKRQIVSWSSHDRNVIKSITGGQAFRYRNAIPTVKRWRRKQRETGAIDDDGSADNSLSHYESLIGYDRPPESHAVGDSIGYIRELKSVTPGAIARWETILAHNEHDLLAMRDVVFTVLDLTDDG